jgi:threonine dehydratase
VTCALAALAFQGCTAVICMPVTSPEIKVAAVRRLGGTVRLVGESYQETQAYAQVTLAAPPHQAAEHLHPSARLRT